jgi:uncharacterized membrane protein YbhN (UPF0104 family)
MDWGQVGEVFRHLRPAWWLAAVGVLVATQVVSALRWQLLAGPLGFHHSSRRFVSYYFIGMYFNLFLPTSVGGDVVRAWYLDGGSGRRLAAFFSAFMDRLSGLVALLGMAVIALALCPIRLPREIAYAVWITAAGIVVGLMMLPVLARCTGRFARVRRLSQSARLFLHHPRPLLASVGLSLFVQAGNVAIVWMVGRAMRAPVPDAYYWILVPMVTLLTMIPISLNGMGVREGGMVLFLHPFGIEDGTAVSLAFLWFLVATAVSLLGGGVYLFGRFPRPQVQPDHEPVCGDSDQGRAGQFKAAA